MGENTIAALTREQGPQARTKRRSNLQPSPGMGAGGRRTWSILQSRFSGAWLRYRSA